MEKNKRENTGSLLLCFIALWGAAVFYYGARALAAAAISVGVCLLCAEAACLLRGRPSGGELLPAAAAGLALALMLPASAPYYVTVICGIFAEAAVIQAFGGHGNEVFSAPAAAFVFGVICFPQEILYCPAVFDRLPLTPSVPNELYRSLSENMLKADSAPVSDYELIIGRCVSPMGTGVILLIAVAGIFLAARRELSVTVFLAQTAVYGGFSLIYGAGIFDLKYNLLSGMYLFGSVFITCGRFPDGVAGKLLYGAITGALICVFRYYAVFEAPIIYAAVISAPFIFILQSKKEAADEKNGVG